MSIDIVTIRAAEPRDVPLILEFIRRKAALGSPPKQRCWGVALLTHLATLADAKGYRRIEWITATDNAKGLAFYQRISAQIHEEVRLLRLEAHEVSRLAREGPPDR